MTVRNAILLLSLALLTAAQQRVAPGVPPAQYQGGQQQQMRAPPPPQPGQYQGAAPGVPPQQYQQAPTVPPSQQAQYQQQQQQYQQPPQQQQYQQPPQQQQQYQQPPQQQQQYQQPPQQYQQPQQAAPGHQPHQPHQNQRVLHNPNLGKEREHIKEHLEVPIDTAGMSEQELQYHYFKMHDADNNNKLDGQELIKSLFHWHDSANHDASKSGSHPEAKLFTDDELVAMIDPILEQDDRNRDGFIDYPEFVQAQRNAAAAAASTGTNNV